MSYNHQEIDNQWQAYWEAHKTYRTDGQSLKPKYYILDMFPYPSGQGLHVGHPKGYVGSDVLARYKRMQGFEVLHPMGWDAFGLPTERQAAKESEHPAHITARNTATFRRQLKLIGLSYDWDREICTSEPDYYRWTQLIFLKLFERGLAYQAEVAVNWCPALGTVLANEEVKDGLYVETGDPVEKRLMKQWMLKITAYADRLLADLDQLDWPESLKEMQRHWIGRAEGARIRFQIADHNKSFDIFTTRPDTLFGCTYCVLAPEHPLAMQITTPEQQKVVTAYIEKAQQQSERERMAQAELKTGVFTGAYAICPANNQRVPIWIADYVLASYGSGAVFACPAHDERDHAFARKFELPIIEVVSGGHVQEAAYTGDGSHVNSEFLNGLMIAEAKQAMVKWLQDKGHGESQINYRLRDWLFSRQRYWGEPIPVVIDTQGNISAVAETDLPILLPHLEDFSPTADGQPPLARAQEWRQTTNTQGQPALRETNTMPQWAGSCWYYLRFLDPHNTAEPWDQNLEKRWMPVDLYIGGTEHATLHLLYARFWHKVLFDLGMVSTPEPFQKLFNQGKIAARSYRDQRGKYYYPDEVVEEHGQWFTKDGHQPLETRVEKMSKSKHNVVTPDEVVADYGADTLRMYELFIGPLEDNAIWQTESISGVRRFLERTWRLFFPENQANRENTVSEAELNKMLHKTIQKVTEDLEGITLNTAISALMILVNEATKCQHLSVAFLEALARLLAPFAPHLAETFWEKLGHTPSVTAAPWPTFDPALVVDQEVTIPVQINGKVRGRLTLPINTAEASACQLAQAEAVIARHLEGVTIKKVIFVANKLLNLVVQPK